jgi:hypothetical protein
MSEPGPAGSHASPSAHSSTAEVRWILPGPLDAATASWFGRYPTGMESREDAYLLRPVLRGLSVKIRAGRLLEVKAYEGSLGILDAAGRARGRIESWRKWSFPFGALGPGDAGPPPWAVVHKRRWISQFLRHDGRLTTEIPLPMDRPKQAGDSVCAVELTEVRLAGKTWWSLGFEATGPADSLRATLHDTAALIFAQAPPGNVEFDLSHCQSYAEWLSRRQIPGETGIPTSGLSHPRPSQAIHGPGAPAAA